MKPSYRVIHQRKSIFHAMLSGRAYTDWYIAQRRRWLGLGWRTLGIFPSIKEAESACAEHAEGTLIAENTRIVSEFSELDR